MQTIKTTVKNKVDITDHQTVCQLSQFSVVAPCQLLQLEACLSTCDSWTGLDAMTAIPVSLPMHVTANQLHTNVLSLLHQWLLLLHMATYSDSKQNPNKLKTLTPYQLQMVMFDCIYMKQCPSLDHLSADDQTHSSAVGVFWTTHLTTILTVWSTVTSLMLLL